MVPLRMSCNGYSEKIERRSVDEVDNVFTRTLLVSGAVYIVAATVDDTSASES